jgi:hypothetical protein
MMIKGFDFHTRYQTIAMLDTETGELCMWPVLSRCCERVGVFTCC